MRFISVVAVTIALAAMASGCGCGKHGGGAAFTVTQSGLQFRDTQVGSGPAVTPYDQVTINFVGKYEDGKTFESTRKPGKTPYSFGVGYAGVAAGLREGVLGMQVGGKRELIVPPDLMRTAQEEYFFPRGRTLKFEIELLKIGQ